MTRDGLTLDNQTTRRKRQCVQPGGRAGIHRPAGGRGGKNTGTGGRTARPPQGKESGQGRRGKPWRRPPTLFPGCSLPPRKRASPELAPYIRKAEKRADKLEAAKEALSKKRVITKETVYDEAKGKAKSRLYFDKVEKAPPQLKPNPASRPIQEAGLYLHGKSMR